MPINLQQTALLSSSPDPINSLKAVRAALEDTQGNILKSHGRDNSHHLFLAFSGTPQAATGWLSMMATQYVTSAWEQLQEAEAFRTSGTDGGLFTNVCLAAAGYAYLGQQDVMPDDPSFAGGAKGAATRLNDPPVASWQAGFQSVIHALVILADDDAAGLAAAVAAVKGSLTGIGDIVDEEVGAAMRVDRSGNVTSDGSGTVHEHFGFADGVSQPLFFADDIEAARVQGGLDRYDSSAPLALVLLKDPGGTANGYGSYFVYRKLQQDVDGFHGDVQKAAKAIGVDPQLAGAYAVGRFEDGTPVIQSSLAGDFTEPNNFNYDADVDGVRCPFHSHTRKANPRGDKLRQFGLPTTEERARRIARRAISFGPLSLDPPSDQPVGLLFIAAQSSIADQFEFIQAIWANFTDFLRPATGVDAVIGQKPDAGAEVPQQWPRVYGSYNELSFANNGPEVISPYVPYQFSQWITMLGGEYFFLPSLSMLKAGATPT